MKESTFHHGFLRVKQHKYRKTNCWVTGSNKGTRPKNSRTGVVWVGLTSFHPLPAISIYLAGILFHKP